MPDGSVALNKMRGKKWAGHFRLEHGADDRLRLAQEVRPIPTRPAPFIMVAAEPKTENASPPEAA